MVWSPVSPDCSRADKKRGPSVVLKLVHRLRRWPNIKSTLGQRLMWVAVLTISAAQISQMWEQFYAS